MPESSGYQPSQGLAITIRALPGDVRCAEVCPAGENDQDSSVIRARTVDWMTVVVPVSLREDRAGRGPDNLGAVFKPRLRGWLHACAFPLAVSAGGLLTVVAPDARARLALALFTLSAALLFGISALYHRGRWAGRAESVLRRLDHANIFLIIAGTYTPFCVLALPSGQSGVLLWIVWCGALAGVAFRVLWVGAPRWLYVPVYVVLGWVAAIYLPAFWRAGGASVVTFLVLGGVLYTLGAVVYGLRRPDPNPRWFGFHEVFHALTVAAFTAHCIGIALALQQDIPL